jgi:uncharacterized protein (TIGR02099 family)
MNTLNEAVHEVEVAVQDALDSSLDAQLPPRERRWLTWLRRAGWALVGLYFLAAVSMLVLRFLALPRVADYKDEIAAAVSSALGEKVTIERVDAEWYGLRPRLELNGVRIYDRRGEEALELPYVGASIAWRSVVAGQLRFESLVLDRPDLRIRRDLQGRLFIAGLELHPADGADRGAADWVLEQGEIIIRDAQVEWRDEARGAPPLALERLNFVLENRGRHHRFALRAEPPRDYASAIDVRGDLIGRTVAQLAEWDGRLYAALDGVDLAAWKAWVDYPFEVRSGRGALRLWLAVEDRRLTELAADLALGGVAARFGANLPALELATVYGQFGVRQRRDALGLLDFARGARIAYDGFARRLALVTPDGTELAPADFTAHWAPAQDGSPEAGEFAARAIELAPLVLLGERLPLPETLREALVRTSPEGRFTDMRFRWTGELARPDTFSARGRFADLGMRYYRDAPGFTHLSGQFDATETGGNATLSAARTTIRHPFVFIEESIAFESLRARLAWSFPAGVLELRFDDVVAANGDLTATASGMYRAGGPGGQFIDITARAANADGRAVYKYIPHLGPGAAGWLRRGIVAGPVSDVRFRLTGNLDDFPFDDQGKGEFRISGKVSGGELDYAPGWPRLTGVDADLVFAGRKLTITSPRASAFGVRLAKVTVVIPDYLVDDPELKIDGQADGPLADYLQFIAASPVRGFIDGVTDGWTGGGQATLALRIGLPIEVPEKVRVAGALQFAGNTLAMGPGDAPLSQMIGTIEFSESSVTSKGIAAQTLGGDVNVQLATREGAALATVQGAVDGAQLARHAGLPFASAVRGQLPFRFTETRRADRSTVVFESTLAGVAVDLPAPFAKAADEAWPLRVERRPLGDPVTPAGTAIRRESVTLSLAKLLTAEGILRTEGGRTSIERVGVGLGDVGVQVPDRPGVFIAGNLKTLDLDRLLPAVTESAAKSGAADLSVTALNLRAQTLTVVGRNFHDVSVRAQFSSARTWQATVDSREMAGEVAWRPEGEGLVTARLKYLALPDPATDPMPGAATATRLPALNIVADRYTLHGRDLGRLEVDAVNERGGWRLEKLALIAPEGAISARGLWQPPGKPAGEQTDLEVKIRADDAGKYLARLGYPDTLSRGTAELDAKAKWTGPIWTIDYPSLTGEVTFRAEKGQFVKLQPGIGKLLGVLSLQSLPRRITLDFNDIFSAGFAFDHINGTASITQGVARTQDLTMVGPAATVVLTGQADLARETQDLSVRVVPVVGDSVAAAAAVALLNPIVGVGALLAQRLLKDPIGQMLAFQYRITGPWDDPQVERVGLPEVQGEPDPFGASQGKP